MTTEPHRSGAESVGAPKAIDGRISDEDVARHRRQIGVPQYAHAQPFNQVASRDDIDTAMRGGCNFPMGPLELLDLVGLDTSLAILDALYTEFRDPNYAAAPTLRRMVAAGRLGRKSGAGFYEY